MNDASVLASPPSAQTVKKPGLSRDFYFIWLGQTLSMLGSMLTSFSLGIWLYQQTGEVMSFVQLTLFSTVPAVVLLPWTGGIADRYNKKHILLWCEFSAMLTMAALGYLAWTNALGVWHLYAAQAVLAVGIAFQGPAAQATITTIVPKDQLGRAGGMFGLASALWQIGAPMMGAGLLALIGLRGIIVLDMATYLFALIGLMLASVPMVSKFTGEQKAEPKLLRHPFRDLLDAVNFMRERPIMLTIYGYTVMGGFLAGMVTVLVAPMVLASYSVTALATITTAAALGALLSGLVMVISGGAKHWTPRLFLLNLITGLAIAAAGITGSVAVISICAFLVVLCTTGLAACTSAVWKRKVPKDFQGRFSAMHQIISLSLIPLSALIGGVLAQHLFEPALLPGGIWFDSVGQWFGTGVGRGTGFLFLVVGLVAVAISLYSFTQRRLYRFEEEIPDAF